MGNNYFFLYIIWAVVGYLVYQDAKKRNLKAAIGWGVLGFLFGLIGVLIYYLFVVRPNKHDQ